MSGKCYLNGILLRNMLLRNKLPRNMLLRITTVYSSMLLGQMFLSCALCQLCNKTHTQLNLLLLNSTNARCHQQHQLPSLKKMHNAFFKWLPHFSCLFGCLWLEEQTCHCMLHAFLAEKTTDFYIYINN